MGKKKLETHIKYDKEADILNFFLGEPYPTANYEVDDNFVFRVDPNTHKLVGLVIHGFARLFPDYQRENDPQMIAPVVFKLCRQFLQEDCFKELSKV